MKTNRLLSILSYPIIFAVVSIGCGGKREIQIEDRNIEYREPLSLSARLGGLVSSEDPPVSDRDIYRRRLLLWETEHDSLVKGLGQSYLAVLDAHRNLKEHLKALKEYLSFPRANDLQDYIDLYDALFLEFERGCSPRILQRKYDSIKEKILEVFGTYHASKL